jgi:ribosomal-protein-alanine N-acetyltransferase
MTDSPTRMPPLTTDRLVIRAFVEDDLDAVYRILDVEDAEAQGQTPPSRESRRETLRLQIAAIENFATLTQPPYGDRAITLRDTGEVIGACGLSAALVPSGRFPALQALGVLPHTAPFYPEVGLYWQLSRTARGNGYATEAGTALIRYAFDVMNLQRIVATTEYDNLASQAVMKRLRMAIERNPLPDPFWIQIVATLANPAVQSKAPFS